MPARSTVAVSARPPALSTASADPMLLTFHATCSDAEGHLLDSARLSGILVELRDGELTRIVTPVADQDGTLVIGAPMGVFSLADGRPGFDPDDDFDASEEEVQR